jgi:hypothetical protein
VGERGRKNDPNFLFSYFAQAGVLLFENPHAFWWHFFWVFSVDNFGQAI